MSAKNFVRVAQQMTPRQEFVSPTKVRMFLPGFPYEAFNSCAYVKPWSLMQLAETHRIMAGVQTPHGVEHFLEGPRLSETHLCFTVAAKLDISETLYDRSIKKGPLTSEMEVVNLSDKSYSVRTSVHLDNCNTPLFTAHVQSILMDIKTRKVTAGPVFWRALQRHVTSQSESLRPDRLPVSGRPPVFIDYSQRVSASDVDPYAHLSWAHAVKFCYNSLVIYLSGQGQPGRGRSGGDGGGGRFERGMDRKVKSLTARYLKEVLLGDRLDVSIWERESNPDLFDFQIHRDGRVTTEVKMEFFPQENFFKI